MVMWTQERGKNADTSAQASHIFDYKSKSAITFFTTFLIGQDTKTSVHLLARYNGSRLSFSSEVSETISSVNWQGKVIQSLCSNNASWSNFFEALVKLSGQL